jgi:hypothetical protein
MRLQKFFLLIPLFGLLIAGCPSKKAPPDVPSDFSLNLDAHSTISSEAAPAQHVNIQISADGKMEFERYDMQGVIVFDENHMVTYSSDQVLESGRLTLDWDQIRSLWRVIEENKFFELNEDYRRSLGLSYAFIVVEANGQRHVVDNIGLEMPEMKAIVEQVNSFLPESVGIDYREGMFP